MGVVVAVLVAAGVIAIPLGGWDTVERRSLVVPEIALGEEYDGRHYAVRIVEAWVGDTLPEEFEEPDEGQTFVVVRAVLRNQWHEPDTFGDDALTFDALDAPSTLRKFGTLRVLSDGRHLTAMPPGVDVEVLVRWEVGADTVAAGEPLMIGIIDGRPEPAILYSGTAWRDEKVVVRARVVPKPSSELEYPWLR